MLDAPFCKGCDAVAELKASTTGALYIPMDMGNKKSMVGLESFTAGTRSQKFVQIELDVLAFRIRV